MELMLQIVSLGISCVCSWFFGFGLSHIWARRVMFIMCDKKKLFSHQTFIL